MKRIARLHRCTVHIVHLCIALLLISVLTVPGGTHAASRYQGVTNTIAQLDFPTPPDRTPVLTFAWGSGDTDLGLVPGDQSRTQGPLSLDIASDGSIAILDPVNRRVQVYDQRGTRLHTIPVPGSATHMRLTSQGVAVTEPWNEREVLEYDLNGTLLERIRLPETVEWPTDLYEVDETIYVESAGQLVALPFTQRPVPDTERTTLPGRPLPHRPGLFSAFGGLEDDGQAVRMVIQGSTEPSQLKLKLADRRILQVRDHFFDLDGNLYVQMYLSESRERALDPERNPEALIKIDAQNNYAGAFLQSSVHYIDHQTRQFAVGPDGTLYQLDASEDGVVIYSIQLQSLGQAETVEQEFRDLPDDLFPEPPARPNIEAQRAPDFSKETRLRDPDETLREEVILSSSYSGAPPMTRDQIIEIAQSAVGSWYVWGGESWSPFDREYAGADCSGLVSTAWQVNHTRPTQEKATSRPATGNLLSSSPYWVAVDPANRQKGDAFVNASHTFLYEAEAGSGLIWAYEAPQAGQRIRHVQVSISGYQLRRRTPIDSTGISGRDKTWIYSDFQQTYSDLGGEAAVGRPFDNGGTILVHRWTTSGEDGFAQDFRGGWRGTGVMMHGDGRPGAFLVHGAIYNTYMGMGGPGSWLGWLTGNEYTYWNGCFNTQRQNFVGGYITQDCGGTWRAY